MTCSVQVHPFAVAGQRERWPEMNEHTVRWLTPARAARAVDEADLAALIVGFGDAMSAGPA